MAGQSPGSVGGGGSFGTGIQQGGQMDQQGSQPGGQTTGQIGQTGGQIGQSGAQMGGQFGGQTGGQGITIDQALTPQMQTALYGFVEAAKVCDWCADQCIDQGREMATCIRLCRDVVDLAELNFKFLARDSVFGPEVATTFLDVANECAQECSRHSHVHCQECARVLNQTIQSVGEMLNSFGGQQGQFGIQQGQQSQVPQQAQVPQQGMQAPQQ